MALAKVDAMRRAGQSVDCDRSGRRARVIGTFTEFQAVAEDHPVIAALVVQAIAWGSLFWWS
jgi:hypothetical protein